MFGNPKPFGPDDAFAGMNAAQQTLSLRMQAYWANFARTGNPNGPGLPAWPAFRATNGQIMNLAPSDNSIGPMSATAFGRDHKCLLGGIADLIQPAALGILDVLPTSNAGR